ncbi:unnamed protein product [Brassica oleracea]
MEEETYEQESSHLDAIGTDHHDRGHRFNPTNCDHQL